MNRILITGGTGNLGRATVRMLLKGNHRVTVLGTKREHGLPAGVDYLMADLGGTRDLPDIPDGIEAVVHCATNPVDPEKVDVRGTERLVGSLAGKGLSHVLYVSIVGVEGSDYPYYRCKLRAERIIRESHLPWTILRFTQFHDFVLHRVIRDLIRDGHPVKVPAGLAFQPIDVNDAAGIIADFLDRPPLLDTSLHGGPEVLSLSNMVQDCLEADGRQETIIEGPSADSPFSFFASGINLCPDPRDGRVTWREFIRNRYREGL